MTSGRQPGPWSQSVFWRLAAVLVGALVLTGMLAVAVSAFLWEARSLELVRNSLALRLDAVAEEVEMRAAFVMTPDGASQVVLNDLLRRDLAARFPDPIGIVGTEGQLLDAPPGMESPADAAASLADGRVEVRLEASPPWALAPLFDAEGVPAGGLLVQPLAASLERELAGTREATRRALWIIGLLALAGALVLGAALTARLVAPLRRMTDRVEAIGAGNYAVRLGASRDDEFGRLAAAINSMAERVEGSIAALKATDKLRRELVANIGHDLRTPLAGVKGYLEEADRLLAANRPEEAAAALATARAQTLHIERLVRDLFELSVLDAAHGTPGARPALQIEPVPVSELLNHAIDGHRPAITADHVRLEVAVPPDLPTILADGGRLLRIIDNLLDNARRHTPAGGVISVAALADAEQVMITVTDTGEGIPAEALDHVFDRYYRGSSARTRAHEGSGLGLAIARAIARAHGGDVAATSRLGEGSTFQLVLPIDGASGARG